MSVRKSFHVIIVILKFHFFSVYTTWNRAVIFCLNVCADFGSANLISWYFSSKSDQSFITFVTFSRCISSSLCCASLKFFFCWIEKEYKILCSSLHRILAIFWKHYLITLMLHAWVKMSKVWIWSRKSRRQSVACWSYWYFWKLFSNMRSLLWNATLNCQCSHVVSWRRLSCWAGCCRIIIAEILIDCW